mgnify:FL=1|tara:strand:+ start:233 stop:490 length:258 start_codon:yes stop_codon:yes gene_type:complete
MVLLGMVIKCYTILAFMTITDEIWNLNNPRPYPQDKYYQLANWEEKDFIFYTDGTYVLREKRKADNETKAEARRLWHERKNKQIR